MTKQLVAPLDLNNRDKTQISNHGHLTSMDYTRNGMSLDAPDELIVTRKGESPQYYKLEKSVLVIGREDDADIPIDAQAISRNHARIESRHGKWYVSDLGSTNGTFVSGKRLPANDEQLWKSGHPIQIGPFTLQWQSARDTITDQTLILAPEDFDLNLDELLGKDYTSDKKLKLEISDRQAEIKEGDIADVRIRVENLDSISKKLDVELAGLPANWYVISHPTLNLQPGASAELVIKITIPRNSGSTGGEHAFTTIFKNVHSQDINVIEGHLLVPLYNDFNLELKNREIQNSGTVSIGITNHGNTSDYYKVRVEDAPSALQFSNDKWDTALMPNTSDAISCLVTAETRPFIGSSKTHNFTIQAKSSSGIEQKQQASIVIAPLVSTWFLIITLLAISIVVTAFYLATLV